MDYINASWSFHPKFPGFSFLVTPKKIETWFIASLVGFHTFIYFSIVFGCYYKLSFKCMKSGIRARLVSRKTCLRIAKHCRSSRRQSVEESCGGFSSSFLGQSTGWVPSGKLTVCYWTWPFIVSFPIKNGYVFKSSKKNTHCFESLKMLSIVDHHSTLGLGIRTYSKYDEGTSQVPFCYINHDN